MTWPARSVSVLLLSLLLAPGATAEESPDVVTVAELISGLEKVVPVAAASSAVREDYRAFLKQVELEDGPGLFDDYVRIKLAFEATRAGGWWGVAWWITDREPNSKEIWKAWSRLEVGDGPLPDVTAVAECDEISALFAFVARRLGLSRRSEVGLFWPRTNHTVAVWTIDSGTNRPVRVVVPTSQIFLGPEESLDTRSFDPWIQSRVYEYAEEDVPPALEIPAALVSAFLESARAHAAESQADLQRRRNDRERIQQGAISAGGDESACPEGEVYRLSDELVRPVLRHREELRPPREGEKHLVTAGVFVIDGIVNRLGRVESLKVLRGPQIEPAWPELEEAALETIRRWIYDPATRDGVPVCVRVTFTLNIDVR